MCDRMIVYSLWLSHAETAASAAAVEWREYLTNASFLEEIE